ncbi:MAG TPA: LytTR family DNA-binding domain-containing protein, partial [Steroidobacteraceae bacterium]|nr:LytTR family DNA-binding domain-containing protein [Steroidobacteraceae bacterium]
MSAVRLKVLIVDDEPPARERLRSLLGELAEVVVVGEAVSGAEALALTHDLSPDIVLLDVRMPGMDGLETARHLNVLEEPPAVIFTTAYDEYAVEAFAAHAVGYLLKPVRKEQLAAALSRAGRLTRAQLQKLAAVGAGARRTHIAARSREGLKLIPIEEVQYFLADQKYTTVRHVHGEDLIEDSLRLLESEFGAAFVRIHRNALIGVKHLERIERNPGGQYFVRLRGCPAPLQVSRRMAGELKE